MLPRLLTSFGLVCGMLAPTAALAGTIYDYLGPLFDTIEDEAIPAGSYDTSMRIEGWIELTAPLSPGLVNQAVDAQVLGFSFSDGRQVIDTGVLGVDVTFIFSTDPGGAILDWGFIMRHTPLPQNPGDPGGSIASLGTLDLASLASFQEGSDRASVEGTGAWTLVPEPSTASLLLLGVVALAWRAGRLR